MYIRILDLETSHETPAEGGGVCEIGWCDLVPMEFNLLGAPTSWQVSAAHHSMLTDPGCPIPAVTSAIHHIIDEDVAGKPAWRDALAHVCANQCGGAGAPLYLAAHSAKFEKLWTEGLTLTPWICTYKAAMRLYPEAPTHSNMGLRYLHRPMGLIRELARTSHRAGPDAYVTAFHLRDMLNAGTEIKHLLEWTDKPALQHLCRIGDWRGKPWSEVDDGFMHWILRKGTFDEDVVFTVRTELDRRQREWDQMHRNDAEAT